METNSVDKSFSEKMTEDLAKSLSEVEITEVISDDALEDLLTKEQRKRDEKITELLGKYVDSYKHKVENREKQRNMVINICKWIVGVLLSCCVFTTFFLVKRGNFDIPDVAVLISAYGSALGSAGIVLKIITQYLFPLDEEKYITDIVKLIQDNDLKNKEINVSAKRK